MSKIKVLYIGHLYEGESGWCRAARDYIRSLNTFTDVVARYVLLSKRIPPSEEIQKLIDKDLAGVTRVVQHLLPHWFDYSRPNRDIKNIGISILESRNIGQTGWASKLNLMDEIWVPYSQGMEEGDITAPKKLVPHACNIDDYLQLYEPIKIRPGFNFYTIGEFIRRKNLPALIRAFHTEFGVHEPVNLIIKTSKFGLQPQEVTKLAQESINRIKEGLKLYPSVDHYKQEIIISDHLSNDLIMGLHAACQCYVNTSYGEAWCYPGFDAMALGNSVISTDFGGPVDYLANYSNGHLVESKEDPCYAVIDTFKDIQTSRETWNSPDVLDLQKKMRLVYETHKNKRDEGLKVAEGHSYERVGKIMEKIL